MSWNRLLLGLLALVLCACQGSPVKRFESIHPGMDKHQVLEIMDSPNTTTRLHGQDRWLYVFYEDKIRFRKEVHFLDGVVVYSGDPHQVTGESSAEARDQKAFEDAAAEDARRERGYQDAKNNAKMFEAYENKVKGTQTVTPLPTFEEIK